MDGGKYCTLLLFLLLAISAMMFQATAEAAVLLIAMICVALAPDQKEEEVEGVRLYERWEGVRVETESREYSDSYKRASRAIQRVAQSAIHEFRAVFVLRQRRTHMRHHRDNSHCRRLHY